MIRFDGYMAGANLGHWISQYGTKGHEHHDTYITAPDFARMASWGMDHVRLPVDYFIFEDDAAPGVYREDGLKYVDFALDCCKKNGLNLVLDLHHAPGFFFGNGKKNDLFTNPASQARFIAIWEMFSRRYASEGDNLTFELLNELVWENSDPWNDLWQRAVAAIRAISPERRIIVGGNYWNSVTELKNLVVSPDPKVFYTFHDYKPMLFTHQHAGWIQNLREFPRPTTYPFRVADYEDFYHGHYSDGLTADTVVNKEYLRACLAPAVEFIEKNKRPLYCGEFGVIANAPLPDAIRWIGDQTSLFNEYGIGHAVWSYRGFSAVTDANNDVVSEEMVRLLSRKE